MNILLVDDCCWLNDYCKSIFAEEGHDVTYSDYYVFLSILRIKGEFLDFVFINVNPYDTKHITNTVQSIYTYAPTAQIVILSINGECPVIKNLVTQGCMHLTIPFETQDLLDTLHKNNQFVY